MCVYPGYHFSRTKINCAKITNLFNVSELLNYYPNISYDCFFQQMCSIFAFQDRLLYLLTSHGKPRISGYQIGPPANCGVCSTSHINRLYTP